MTHFINRYPQYKHAWKEETSPLYNAPECLLQRLDSAEITEEEVSKNTRWLFDEIYHSYGKKSARIYEFICASPKEISFNPNASLEPTSKPVQNAPYNIMLEAIQADYSQLAKGLLNLGWSHTTIYDEGSGCPGLIARVAQMCSPETVRAFKEYSDRHGDCISANSPSQGAIDYVKTNHPGRADYERIYDNEKQKTPNALLEALDNGYYDTALELFKWDIDLFKPDQHGKNVATIVLEDSENESIGHSAPKMQAVITELLRAGVLRVDFALPPDSPRVSFFVFDAYEKMTADLLYRQGHPTDEKTIFFRQYGIDVYQRLWTPLEQYIEDPQNHAFDVESLTSRDLLALHSICKLDAVLKAPIWHGHEQAFISLVDALPKLIREEMNASGAVDQILTKHTARAAIKGPAKDWSTMQASAPESEVQR